MFCINCGKEIPDNSTFCIHCGTNLQASNTVSTPQQYNYEPTVQLNQPDLPMKWYKFLIYFSLFFGAVLWLISGVMYFTGAGYIASGLDVDWVYSYYDGLKVLDIGYGIISIAFIPFALFVRSALAKFKKDAFTMFYIYNIAGTVITVSYAIFSLLITGVDFPASSLGSIVGTVVFIVLNVKYFNKRKHLFVN